MEGLDGTLDLRQNGGNELLSIGDPAVKSRRRDAGNTMISLARLRIRICISAMNDLMTPLHRLIQRWHERSQRHSIQADCLEQVRDFAGVVVV